MHIIFIHHQKKFVAYWISLVLSAHLFICLGQYLKHHLPKKKKILRLWSLIDRVIENKHFIYFRKTVTRIVLEDLSWNVSSFSKACWWWISQCQICAYHFIFLVARVVLCGMSIFILYWILSSHCRYYTNLLTFFFFFCYWKWAKIESNVHSFHVICQV